jgi:hypothetical protein
MPFTPGHTSSSGSRLQPLTPAELSKMNKPDLNRERNALLAELAVARGTYLVVQVLLLS